MTERSEFIVVGAGLLGLATARALASRGREVIVLEQAEINSAAHADHIHESGVLVVRRDFDHSSWYG